MLASKLNNSKKKKRNNVKCIFFYYYEYLLTKNSNTHYTTYYFRCIFYLMTYKCVYRISLEKLLSTELTNFRFKCC